MEENKNFEESLQELETIVKELESGNVNLDDAINKYTEAMKLAKYCGEKLNDATKKALVKSFDNVLSLDLLKENKKIADDELIKYVQEQINLRLEAKKNKDFQTADKIRDELLEKGISLKDTKEGTTWNF